MNRYTLFALACGMVPATLCGQPATGVPAFGSFSGGPFDVVNNSNLNVHFEIPIINKAGRGTPFAYTLTYDSSVWYPTGGVWMPVNNWGWKAATAVALTGHVSYGSSPQSCLGTNFTVYAGWGYYDPYGVAHYFPGTLAYPIPPQGCGTWQDYLNNVAASDGSGYSMSFSVAGGTPTVTSLLSPNGTTISAPLGPYGQPPSGAGSLTDRNGNIITISTGSTATFTDTLGDTALTVSGSGTPSSPTVLSYTNPQTTTSSYKINYTAYTVQTAFGCPSITEYGASAQNLVSSITLPDNTTYSFGYETAPGHSPNVTGRLASVTLPTGGTISYSYTGGYNGITCADGTAATLHRTTPDSATAWVYAHAETGCTSGSTWCTTITDPSSNETDLSLTPATTGGVTNGYELQRLVYQGAKTTLLQALDTCYNGASPPCPTAILTSFPPSPVINRTIPGGYTLQAYKTTNYNGVLPTEVDEYDYGNGGQGTLLRKTITSYAALGNNIIDMPASITVETGGGTAVAKTTYTYDYGGVTATTGTPQHANPTGSRGNATTIQYQTGASSSISQTYTYYDTGTVNVFTDVNGGQTTYTYGTLAATCGNSFATGITEAVNTLKQFYVWNCNGGVSTSTEDENSQYWYTTYNDLNYWRPTSTADPASATTNLNYHTGPFASESTLNFNGTTSTVDTRTTLDGLGRAWWTQRQQGQGLNSYDTAQTLYDAEGRPWKTTVPFTNAAPTSTTQNNTTAPYTQTTYEALGRPRTVTDSGNPPGTTTYTYLQTPSNHVGFDVLVTVSGGQTFKKQLEYDGLGRLTSVCEITSASGIGAGNCAQSVSQTGFWTTYTYDVLNNILTVKQNAQSSISYQTRTYAYDGLSRMTSEQNPETSGSAYTYTFDTDTTCGTHNGDMVKRVDPYGTVTCYAYDALHRLTGVTYPSGGYSSVTPSKTYVYDSATVNSTPMAYAMGRLAEAYTGSSKTTDLGFSYTNRGEAAGVYQSSPHSGGYYHIAATYWAAQGLLDTLNPNMTGMPTWTYKPEGEGRVNLVSASSGTNPVTATSYNGFSETTGVTFGSSDSDAFQYDSNTGRMTQYKATINGSAAYGTLTWNANWTLKTLATTDPFNSGNNGKTCSYAYDDLARISQADCGSGNWGQNFSYVDNGTNTIAAFGNLSKSVLSGRTGQSFAATYSDTTNRLTQIGSTNVTYDSNGNILSDGFYTYTWDGEGDLATLGGNTETYDALGRRVEQSSSGVYTEIVYNVDGSKLALTSGQTVTKVFVPLSGGATAVYTSSGLAYYRHSDWLGSSRIASTPSRTVYYDGAYAPYGENYAETGTTDRNFTGQNQDLTPGSSGLLYDFPNRELHSIQGRWISPDPAGINAVDPTNPQSWNRYAYVLGNPLANTDPLGLGSGCGVNGEPPCPPPGWTSAPNTYSTSGCVQWFMQVFNMTNGPATNACAGFLGLFGPIQLYSGGPTGGSGGGATPAANNNPCSNATLSAAGVNVQQQIATAQGYIAAGRIGANATPYANPGLGFFGGMYGYYSTVKTGGPNDIKNLPGHSGRNPIDVDAGNISFGVTCPYGAGFCQFAAGLAQSLGGHPNFNGTLAAGFDTPSDNAAIRVGQAMRAAGCHE